MTKVTLKDIADKVGISQQTVSKVLNKRNFTVSTATKRKILATARKLNYRPNLFAQVLKTGRTNMIGVATMGSSLGRFDMPYAGRVYQGIGDFFAKHNYKLIFRNLHELMGQDMGLNLAENRAVDGLIFLLFSHEVAPFKKKQAPVLDKLGIPFVLVHSLGEDFGFNSVGLDCVRGGELAAAHLLDHGYHSAGGIGCVKTPTTNIHCTHLLTGFKRGLAAHGVRMKPKHVFDIPRVETRLGYQLAKDILSRKADLPRALFVIDDEIVFGLQKGLAEAGIRVPQDLALIGFGDRFSQDYFLSTITSVEQPALEKGYQAAELLYDQLSNNGDNKKHRTVINTPKLIIGNSCGCIKKGRMT